MAGAETERLSRLVSLQTLDEVLAHSVAQPRLYSTLLAAFSSLAVLLAAVGIYGVMSFAVGQRRHEIGVRMALGARPGAVQRQILREGMTLAGAGVVLGLAGGAGLTRLMGKLLYGIAPTDAAAFGRVAALLAAVAAAACYLPSCRATLIGPMAALRSE